MLEIEESLFFGSSLIRNIAWCFALKATSEHHYVDVDYNSVLLSHVVDHPMSSPCCVAKAGPVLAYRIMYLNDVVPASSPMISLDIKYSTHLV